MAMFCHCARHLGNVYGHNLLSISICLHTRSLHILLNSAGIKIHIPSIKALCRTHLKQVFICEVWLKQNIHLTRKMWTYWLVGIFCIKHRALILFLIYLLIMLLQLSHFPPHSTPSCPPPPSHIPPYSSCPWVIHISSLASTFPTLFLPSPCLFSTYHLCYLFSVPFPPSPSPTPLLTPLHVISISMVLFLF